MKKLYSTLLGLALCAPMAGAAGMVPTTGQPMTFVADPAAGQVTSIPHNITITFTWDDPNVANHYGNNITDVVYMYNRDPKGAKLMCNGEVLETGLLYVNESNKAYIEFPETMDITADGTYTVQVGEPGNDDKTYALLDYDNDTIITLNFTYTIGADTGVEDIKADNAPVYYNLQGQQVANPQGGVFVKVQGNKASKVRL